MMRVSLRCSAVTIAACCLMVLAEPATAVAQATESIEYFHTDAIGSVRMVTGPSGEVLERRDFLPFGEEPAPPPDAQPVGFVGTERDADTGNSSWPALNYLGARHLHSSSGRFTTVDPGHVGGYTDVPQSWNGYAYAGNNPIRFIDPEGTDYRVHIEDGGQFYDVPGNFAALQRWATSRFVRLDGDDYSGVLRSPVERDDAILGRYLSVTVNDEWWEDFGKSLGKNLVAGVRQPDQTMSQCINQNVRDTTFGAIDPDKLFDPGLLTIGANASVLSTARVSNYVDGGVNRPVALGTQLLRMATGALGLRGAARVLAVTGGVAALRSLAVTHAASLGVLAGSTINCLP